MSSETLENEPPSKKVKLEDAVETPLVMSSAALPKTEDDEDDDDDLFGDGDDDDEKTEDSIPAPGITTPIKSEPSPGPVKAEPSPAATIKAESSPVPPIKLEPSPAPSAALSSVNEKDDIAIPRKKAPARTLPDVTASVTAKDDMAIPRKSSALKRKNSPVKQEPPVVDAKQRVPGSRFGLPDGVVVPFTIVQNRLLDTEMHAPGSKLLSVLKSLPVNLINDALTEYDDAVEIKGAAAIRNHGAYLYGVVKRYVSVHERALAGEGTGILPMGEDGLTDAVEQRLQQLVTSGFCSVQEMNDKVKSKIRMLSEKDALFALDELSSVDRSSIRNFGSYFMGILNRYMRGDASSKARPKQHQNRPSQSSSYQPRDRDQYNNNAYRKPGNDYRNNNMYDNRQQKSWQQPPPQMGMNHQRPQGPPPGHMSQSGGMPHNHQHGGGFGRGPHPPPPHFGQQHQHNPQFANNMQQQPHHQQQHQQQQPFVPGYPPNHPPQQQGYTNNGFQHAPPPMGGQQFNMGNQPQHQYQPGMQQHQEQSFRNPSWQDPPQPPVDIMGLADKAMQALGGGGGPNNAHHNYPPPAQQQQQHGGYQSYRGGVDRPVGQHPHMPQQQYPPQNQPYAQPPQFGGGHPNDAAARRRTTATVAELPVAVQYAVQNLVNSSALDGLPDEGIVGMIHDLPEQLALASLQKFESLSSAKQCMMRNKTAYLAGVLRRELEKINRR